MFQKSINLVASIHTRLPCNLLSGLGYLFRKLWIPIILYAVQRTHKKPMYYFTCYFFVDYETWFKN
jgi:hypothetical protein